MRPVQGVSVLCAVGLMTVVLAGDVRAMQGAAPAPPRAATAVVTPPADYVIGPDDILSIVFWDDSKMTADVVVRPDGKITLPLLNDVQAAGLTPEQLKEAVTKQASPFFKDLGNNVMVRVREIKSRNVTVVGEVAKQGPIMIGGPTTVVQLLGLAGGLLEFADAKNILVVRTDATGQQQSFKFNFNDFKKGKNLRQNILLKPGDTVVVP